MAIEITCWKLGTFELPRGGARAGAGRKPKSAGTHSHEIVTAAKNAAVAATLPALQIGQKTAVEILREASNALYAMAGHYRPTLDAAGKVIAGDEAKFRGYLTEAGAIAGKLAPFEGPTFSSVRYTQQPVDLSKFSVEELIEYERLTTLAAAGTVGNPGRDREAQDSAPRSASTH